MKKVWLSGVIAGLILTVVCYGGLFLSIKLFPSSFESYLNPLFHSDGSRDVFFYTHAMFLSLALSFFWQRFKLFFKGHAILRGLEFGLVYSLVALGPIMWMIYSAMDVTASMVFTWYLYGLFQATVVGIVFAKLNP